MKTILCFYCWTRDTATATKSVMINIMISSFIIGNWIIWTTAFNPVPKSGAMPLTGFTLKWLGFGIQLTQFIYSLILLIKCGKNFLEHRGKIKTYAIFTFYISILQLLFLFVMVCLTAIAIENAVAGDGLSSTSTLFRVSRFVILGCIIVAIWEIHMGFGLWKAYDDCGCGAKKQYGVIMSNVQVVKPGDELPN